MAEKTTIARPYARAAFEIAAAVGELKPWSELLTAAGLIVSDPGVKPLLTSPHVTPEQIAGLIAELCGDLVTDQRRNFLLVLAESYRLNVLPQIAEIFNRLKAEAENTIDVAITSAVPLDDKQKTNFAKALKKRLGRDVILHCETDESLIGGAIIRAEDLVIDGSLKGRLAKMVIDIVS